MIIKTTKIINDSKYEYTYSDANYMIERDGVQYADAIDPIGSNRVYTETDIPIEPAEEEATEQDYIAALAELGVNTSEEENA